MRNTNQSFDLQRFVDAQNPVYQRVCSELRAGQKQSCWMWFIFPQVRGLGHSPTAQTFAISSRQEAEAYAQHAVLGARLRECTQLVNALENRTVSQVFGFPDDLKFHSCMTLFARAASHNQPFLDALKKFFAGKQDQQTLDRL
jgi:uncharacterized protein (DUF1810 family)